MYGGVLLFILPLGTFLIYAFLKRLGNLILILATEIISG
jgi:hypothetical protein